MTFLGGRRRKLRQRTPRGPSCPRQLQRFVIDRRAANGGLDDGTGNFRIDRSHDIVYNGVMDTTTDIDAMTDRFEDDIPLDIATAAHCGTSFVPEQRGAEEVAEYADRLRRDRARLQAMATPEAAAEFDAQFERYRQGFRKRAIAYLTAKSRCVSTMIAGPANFNARQAEKRGSSADKKNAELWDFRERAIKAILRSLGHVPYDVIPGGDNDAVPRLQAKISEAEDIRARMKAENEAARKDGKAAVWASYQFTNLGSNIRRMKDRVAQISHAQNMPNRIAIGSAARLEDAPAENRVRLFYPGKPEDDVRASLMSQGFRWTPTFGCWQAYRNMRSLEAAAKFAGITTEQGA